MPEEEEESTLEEEPLGGVTVTLVQLPTVGRGTPRAPPARSSRWVQLTDTFDCLPSCMFPVARSPPSHPSARSVDTHPQSPLATSPCLQTQTEEPRATT